MSSTPSKDSGTAAAPARRARRRKTMDRLVVGSLLLAAALFAIWPVAATYNNNFKAWQAAQTAVRQTSEAPPEVNEARLAAAREYNDNLGPTLLTDPIGQANHPGPEYQDYLSRLPGPAMATLRLPTIESVLPVMHGTSDEVLNKGAGHIYGTHLPVGGEGTHAGLSAHRGLPQMTAFDNLPDMRLGDEFFVDVAGQTLAYRVNNIDTVLPDEMHALDPVVGEDLLTLITCTPYGVNSHRILVTGERIDLEVADPVLAAASGFDWTPQGWMWPRIAMTAGALAALLLAAVAWTSGDIRAATARRKAAKTKTSTPPTDTVPDAVPA